MDRCVVLVDAGYLLGGAATLLAGSSNRDRLQPDYPALVDALSRLAFAQTGLPVLRIYWYDAARDRQPTSAHRILRVLPDVKVRLGNLVSRDDGRLEQKGVDAELHGDLTTLARHRAVSDIVLVTGDEDLRRAVEEAQEYGVRVHLWAVEAAAPEFNQSQELIASADRRHVLSHDWLVCIIRAGAAEEPPDAQDDPDYLPSQAPDHLDTGMEFDGRIPETAVPAHQALGGSHVPSPLDLARLHPRPAAGAGPAIRYSSGAAAEPAHAGTDSSLPRLREITTGAQAWRDNEDDATSIAEGPAGIGQVFGARWACRADLSHYETLVADYPVIPRHIDGELLRYAEKLGTDTWEDESAKHEIRSGFWRGVEGVAAARAVRADRHPPASRDDSTTSSVKNTTVKRSV
jgi:uncharacterized LabA/DUF88 family protein